MLSWTRGVAVLPCCPPSGLADEVMALLQAAEDLDPRLAEILGFVEAARAEAGDEEVWRGWSPAQAAWS
jgi:hypothetical protein